MNNKHHPSRKEDQFLHNEEFISWRLFQTKELDDYWNDFRQKNPHLEKALQEAIRQFDAVEINRYRLDEKDRNEVYNTVIRHAKRYKRRRLTERISAVAAVLLIGILSLLFITQMQEGNGVILPKGDEMIVGEALPEEEIYLISAGKKINLAGNSHIGLTEDGKALVTDSTSSPKELLLARTELNRLVVPYGKRSNLTLSDGTEVWLNSGTELDFPSAFSGKTREIHVNGEIFIEVAHNREMPFIVHTKDMDVLVQGTSFNISAYRDDIRKTVVLVDGKVKIESGSTVIAELLPNEKVDITENNILKERVDVSEYISWTKGILEFNNTPMSEILKKIGRYYNVQFEGTADIPLNKQTCSGKLFLSNNLDSVMTSVSILSSTVYKRENNKIHISKKQMPMK
ncbi:MAG: Sigma factor regulatory protein, FecR/PupR family [Proteiniphilum acetatigenes]|uniref:Sigma factor regulatory protein, FecR/PupR family n=1 Tax=Proteiniphilum acetatigenes TaxID=294710 RepID=A0A117M0Z3_9BACT|nr:MAG: Sigma factor regulatory protein, FecR/PupR family [Proteiniphilum acetatigenes]